MFFSDELTTDGLPVSDRVDDGLLFLLAAFGLAIAFVLARRLIAAGERVVLGAAGTRRAKRAALIAAVVDPLVALTALALSDRA